MVTEPYSASTGSPFWLFFPPLTSSPNLDNIPPETVAYPNYHQHLTHRGVVWPLENETPFLERDMGLCLTWRGK